MFEWVVFIKGRRYSIQAVNRNKAKYAAVREYKRETGDTQLVDVLAALASCIKVEPRERRISTNA